MEITKAQLDQDEKEANGRLQNIVNRINTNNQAVQQIQSQSIELAQEARRVEGELRLIKQLKERFNGTEPQEKTSKTPSDAPG